MACIQTSEFGNHAGPLHVGNRWSSGPLYPIPNVRQTPVYGRNHETGSVRGGGLRRGDTDADGHAIVLSPHGERSRLSTWQGANCGAHLHLSQCEDCFRLNQSGPNGAPAHSRQKHFDAVISVTIAPTCCLFRRPLGACRTFPINPTWPPMIKAGNKRETMAHKVPWCCTSKAWSGFQTQKLSRCLQTCWSTAYGAQSMPRPQSARRRGLTHCGIMP